ncbi:hypothetical protein ABVT39_009309 [Epinephelus coioides]
MMKRDIREDKKRTRRKKKKERRRRRQQIGEEEEQGEKVERGEMFEKCGRDFHHSRSFFLDSAEFKNSEHAKHVLQRRFVLYIYSKTVSGSWIRRKIIFMSVSDFWSARLENMTSILGMKVQISSTQGDQRFSGKLVWFTVCRCSVNNQMSQMGFDRLRICPDYAVIGSQAHGRSARR